MLEFTSRYLGTDARGTRTFFVISLSSCIYWFLSIKGVIYEPFRQALGVTNTQLGFLLGVTGFVQVFGYLLLGWIQDFLVIRKVIAFDLVAYGLIAMSLAVATDLPFWYLVIAFACFGLFGEALYWPTIQKSTRGLSDGVHQAALFSTQEAMRGVMGLFANMVTLVLFTVSLSPVTGARTAMTCYALLMMVFSVIVLRNIPEDFLHDDRHDAARATRGSGDVRRTGLAAIVGALRLPIVWTTGLATMAGYTAYIAATTYTLPLLQQTFGLSDTQAAVYGLINTGIFPVVSALASGAVAKRFADSPRWMVVLFLACAVCALPLALLPKRPGWFAACTVVTCLLALTCYAIRAVYYVPIGEYGVPNDQSATVMSVTSFLGYMPSFFAYPLFGAIIDGSATGADAYRTVFVIILLSSLAGAGFSLCGHRLIAAKRRG
ncbi:Major Facilitator Superfamily [Bifidobacterium ramosum]|uniref:MFS transporter n=1 Tax=Bifidobacterium ramosum TaxID=1798158 RepID=A0A6L4X4F1_9BIFI|nr:MFS transporter [Bifidobacterium ramosum]KAB8289077.1 Major Facilitator Superfamily [Bifidobacterium ramosum]NEG70790.1 MFS transporter [Bifidobacterium ramosum]